MKLLPILSGSPKGMNEGFQPCHVTVMLFGEVKIELDKVVLCCNSQVD